MKDYSISHKYFADDKDKFFNVQINPKSAEVAFFKDDSGVWRERCLQNKDEDH